MPDCACCAYVVDELRRAKDRIKALEEKLATAEGWAKHYRERYTDAGVENNRLARRIRSFEGAAKRRRIAKKAVRLAAKGKR